MPRRAESVRRYAALAAAVWRARRRPFDPFKLTWIVTERCSLACRTCQLWSTAPQAGPDLDTVARVVAANPQLTWLNLSGGDLVERPDAPALIERVVTGLPDLALLDFPTAGQDAGAALAALQPALDSDVPRLYVTVSLDGPDATHDRLRGRRGAAARARATLRRLAALRRPGLAVLPGMTLSRHNVPPQLPADWRSLLPDDVDPAQLHLNLAHHSTHYYRNRDDVAPPPAAAGALVAAVQAARPRSLSPLELVERRYWTLARRFLAQGDAGQACGALSASVFLGADLMLHPCSIFDRPLGRLDAIGFSLRRIPELPGAAAARADVIHGACPRCWSPCEAFPTLLVRLGRSR